MLPIIDKPLVQYAVEEALQLGLKKLFLLPAHQNIRLKNILIFLNRLNKNY
jgi:UTP-glucose-1-phosphate uridylyltransferase